MAIQSGQMTRNRTRDTLHPHNEKTSDKIQMIVRVPSSSAVVNMFEGEVGDLRAYSIKSHFYIHLLCTRTSVSVKQCFPIHMPWPTIMSLLLLPIFVHSSGEQSNMLSYLLSL